MNELRFRGTRFQARGKFGSRVESTFDVPWTEAAVAKVFPELIAPTKDGVQLWGAAQYREGANRGNAGLDHVWAAVLDADCTDPGRLEQVLAALDAARLAYVVHTSWSHADAAKVHADTARTGPFDCFRVVLPYSRPISAAEHAAIVPGLFGHEVPADPAAYAAEVLGRWVKTANSHERAARPRGWDPASARPAQAYYVPASPAERAHRAALVVATGRPLDVEAILGRPSTPRPSTRLLRTRLPPTLQAVGQLGVVVDRLQARGFGVSGTGFGDWHRSVCPSCKDPSPSLTFQSDGDGVRVHCHAQCRRADILAAIDLHAADFASPSDLRLELDEQLSAQIPREEPVPVDEAVIRLTADIRAAVAAGTPTVIKYPAGTGKSRSAAIVLAEVAATGHRIAYSTQEHVVAAEVRSYLPPWVSSVHIHSPLVAVPGEPVCARADELRERVFEYGVKMLGDVCPKCPLRTTCAALEAAKQRQRDLERANVVFVSHAGIPQIVGLDADGRAKGADLQTLIVDEMPAAFARVGVTPLELERLETGVLPSVSLYQAATVRELARAYRKGEPPGEVVWGPRAEVLGRADELAAGWGRVGIREDAHPRADEGPLLRAADALFRLAAHRSEGGLVFGIESPSHQGISAMLPDACHAALVEKRGVLLSATPFVQALPGFDVRELDVTDGVPVRRVMVLRKGRGSSALASNYYDDERGRRDVRPPEPGEEPGIPWPIVDEALARAVREADVYGPEAKVLFVTFKRLADALRDGDRLLGGRIQVAHFGALRGKNDWQEGRPGACRVAYLLGTPRFDLRPVLAALGLYGEAADQAWRACAAGELTQAEGRLRLPRRKTPCTILVEGDVAPSTWHPGNVNEVITDGPTLETPSSLLEGALLWYGSRDVSRELGITEATVRKWNQPGRPPPHPKHASILRELASPDMSEAAGLLHEMRPGRRETHERLFSWTPDDP